MADEPNAAAVPPPMRASNDDRQRVAGVLQKAMAEGRITVAELETRLDSVYAAKTLAELEPVTVDLPGHPLSLRKPEPLAEPAAARMPLTGVGPDKANMVAIMSGVVRKGRWTVPAHINAVAIMGGVELDFTEAALSARETVMNVTAIMGGVDITVPEGLTVIVHGFGFMGGFQDDADQQYGPESPVRQIKGAAIMGGVQVKTRRGQAEA